MLEYCAVSDTEFSVPWTLDRSGRSNPSRETPERVEAACAGLRRGGARPVPPGQGDGGPVDAEALHTLLSSVHGEKFLTYLRAAGANGDDSDDGDGDADGDGESALPGSGFAAPGLAQDTPVLPGAWRAALDGASTAAAAAGRASRSGTHVYAACRPPGHHAGPDWHGGYCFVNNAMIAAEALVRGGAGGVAVIDVDYHLGNGTLACADRRDDVDYFSVHSSREEDFPYTFPQRDGLIGLTGSIDHDGYLDAVSRLTEAAGANRPDAVVVSAGFDILADDPHGSWNLDPRVWHGIGRRLARLGVPVVLVQEGGYSPRALEASTYWLAKGLTA